jgi:DNA-binding response OmpR family regulator
MRRPNTVFSKEQLLREICGWEGGADTNLVEVHISALRGKIGDKGKRLIRTVRGVGYSLG